MGLALELVCSRSCSISSLGVSSSRIAEPLASRRSQRVTLGSRRFHGMRAEEECPGSQQIIRASSGNEVAVEIAHGGSAKKLDVAPIVEEPNIIEDRPAMPSINTSISAFMADVANLVKLVDSRDIVELELKSKDYEIIIRKEASQQPQPPPMSFPGPHVMAHTTFPGYASPPLPTPALAAPFEVASPAPVPAAASPIPTPSPDIPSHPPMLSPMAGTFYRSPGPGEAPFLQIGDTVVKGQVVCIIEAMKLMNEIEADQSGTLVEIIAEDGKPVSIESPLFLIKP